MNRLNSLASTVGQQLKDRAETIAIAESSTGGLISAALLAVPGCHLAVNHENSFSIFSTG